MTAYLCSNRTLPSFPVSGYASAFVERSSSFAPPGVGTCPWHAPDLP